MKIFRTKRRKKKSRKTSKIQRGFHEIDNTPDESKLMRAKKAMSLRL